MDEQLRLDYAGDDVDLMRALSGEFDNEPESEEDRILREIQDTHKRLMTLNLEYEITLQKKRTRMFGKVLIEGES